MSVTLTPRTEAEIRRWIDTGRYADADAVIHKALEALEVQEQERFLKLRELVLAGHNSGPGEELTDELWEEIAREADEADCLGLPIRRDVQP
ncbi:MAG: Bacterial antitoxin of ParD toxin-antitoxin type system [Thermomicrobiales bacterium]|nr:Bacterial antitoxin of ParD toxin-antitoxin type system [Thermomicrobiales bacterium]